MGLDITAYENIKKLDVVFDARSKPIDPVTREPLDGDYFQVSVNDDFPGRAEPMEDHSVYAYDKSLGFSAGSYGGYSQWRNQLAELAGYPLTEYQSYSSKQKDYARGAWAATEGPFWELINFSDCEGVIGSVVAAKLAKDFAEFQSKADAHQDQRFRDRYALWKSAFEMATNNGAVDFH